MAGLPPNVGGGKRDGSGEGSAAAGGRGNHIWDGEIRGGGGGGTPPRHGAADPEGDGIEDEVMRRRRRQSRTASAGDGWKGGEKKTDRVNELCDVWIDGGSPCGLRCVRVKCGCRGGEGMRCTE